MTAEAQRRREGMEEKMKLPSGTRQMHGSGSEGEDYPHRELTEQIIGCAIKVHRELKAGFLEKIYENALAYELTAAGLRVERQVQLPVHYRGVLVGEHYADLIVEGKVVVELKAVDDFCDQHVAQVMSTMKAAGLIVGLLLNFHAAKLVDGIRRVVMQNSLSSAPSAPLR